jgi:two-component system sensor histidine kinase KdpD
MGLRLVSDARRPDLHIVIHKPLSKTLLPVVLLCYPQPVFALEEGLFCPAMAALGVIMALQAGSVCPDLLTNMGTFCNGNMMPCNVSSDCHSPCATQDHSCRTDLGAEGNVLLRVVRLLSRNDLSFGDKLQKGLLVLLQRMGAERGSIMLLTDDHNGLEVMASSRPSLIGLIQEVREDTVAGHVLATGEPLLIRDIGHDERFQARGVSYKTTSLVSVPLRSSQGGKLLGVVNVSDRQDGVCFDAGDATLLQAYAGWIAPLLENCRLLEQVRQEKDRYKVLARELEHKRDELLISTMERADLVQMVVHDFKSPLSAIIATYDLRLYMGVDEKQQHIIANGLDGAKNLRQMIDDFLETARTQEFQGDTVRLVPVDIARVIHKEVEGMRPVFEQRNLILQVAVDNNVLVSGEPSLLAHLVQNLLSNGVKYTPKGGLMRIQLVRGQEHGGSDPKANHVTLWVEDSGMGVPDASKEQIFERYARTSQAVEQGIQGTGVGLYMCRKIVRLLGGTIRVEDSGLGGAKFCVDLPAFGGEIHD